MRTNGKTNRYTVRFRIAILLIGILTAQFAAQLSLAGESDVTFKGRLTQESCTVASGSDGEAVEVDFGSIPDTFLYQHQRTATKKFIIQLLDCDLTLGSTVNVSFSGTEDAEQAGLLAVTGEATHIAVALTGRDGQSIVFGVQPLPSDDQSGKYSLNSGVTTLEFGAYVQASNGALAAHNIGIGKFAAVANFTLDYI